MRIFMRVAVVVSLFLINVSRFVGADDFLDVRELIHDRMSEENIPSVVAGVSRGEEVLWTEAFGLSDRENCVAATVDTAYRIGSTTKPLTVTAVTTRRPFCKDTMAECID